MSFLKKETTEKQFDHYVLVEWHSQGNLWWNETCAMVLEVFGLPGDRFTYTPREDCMVFKFATERDEQLCRILLSERL
jgi:hypothetical protein